MKALPRLRDTKQAFYCIFAKQNYKEGETKIVPYLETGIELRQLPGLEFSSSSGKCIGFIRAPKKKQEKMRMAKLPKTQCHDPKWCRTQAASGVIETEPTLLPIKLAVNAKLCLVVK